MGHIERGPNGKEYLIESSKTDCDSAFIVILALIALAFLIWFLS